MTCEYEKAALRSARWTCCSFGLSDMGGASGDGHAATPAWDYEVVTIVVVIGTSLLAFGLESVHHHSHHLLAS